MVELFALDQSHQLADVIIFSVVLKRERKQHFRCSGVTNTLHSFFHNKGAVAGVFAAVGVVALILFIVFITNEVRRRRAKKFDREVAEAAAEAAASGHRPQDFDDDDFGYTVNHSVYTGDSHGTYSQQPLQPMESYNMSEIQPGAYDPYATSVTGAGNAGIGTGSGLNRAKSQSAPYNAFAGPGNSPPHPNMPVPADPADPFYDPSQGASMPAPRTMADTANAGYAGGTYGQAAYNPQSSLLEAAGLASGVGVGVEIGRAHV